MATTDRYRVSSHGFPPNYTVADSHLINTEAWGPNKDAANRSASWMNERHEAGKAHGSCSNGENCDYDRIISPEKCSASDYVLCAKHKQRMGRA